jgi:hypothetical protein
MSSISSLPTTHPISLQLSTYPHTQLVVCINPLQDILPSPLITPSNSFDNETKSSNDNCQELIQRLCHQRSKLTRLYDLEIERSQSTSKLIIFLNKIDQLLNEYETHQTTSLIIGKKSSYRIFLIEYLDDTTNTNKHLDDESYSTYFNGKSTKIL